jgi:hypothetical protein
VRRAHEERNADRRGKHAARPARYDCAVNITRFHLGERALLSPLASGGVAYHRAGAYFELAEPVRAVTRDAFAITNDPPPPGPFVRGDFGDRDRLTWTNAGCALPQDTQLVQWGARYALWLDGADLVLADSTRTDLVRLAISLERITHALVVGDDLWLVSPSDVTRLVRPQLEALFEQASPIAIAIREHYPHARPNATLTMFVRYLFQDRAWLECADRRRHLHIPRLPGLEEGAPLTLHDEVMTDVYREVTLGNRPRRPIHDVPFPESRDVTCALRIEPATDPAGPLSKPSTSVRTDDLDRVFAALADDPADQANRMVIVDLLEDAGEPYAPHFAALLAGHDRARDPALGPLANFIHDVAWHDALPCAGTLAATAPLDDTLVAHVLTDLRLGFFHTLRLGDGNFQLYSKLVTSPRAVALRHVDGSRTQILTALIAARRTGLRRLSGVKFATREALEALADPTFDRVDEVETQTRHDLVPRLLDFIERDQARFFARAPRHLVLTERDGDDDALAPAVLTAWPRLPLAKLTMGGVTIARDGTVRVRPGTSDAMRALVGTQFHVA